MGSMLRDRPDFEERVPIVDAIESLVPILSQLPDGVMAATAVFGDVAGPLEIAIFQGPERTLPPDDVLFHLAHESGAGAMLFASPAAGSIVNVAERDIELSKGLLAAGERAGIEIIDHIVVKDGAFRFMSSTGLWPAGAGLDPDL
jgi:hypothetical protein